MSTEIYEYLSELYHFCLCFLFHQHKEENSIILPHIDNTPVIRVNQQLQSLDMWEILGYILEILNHILKLDMSSDFRAYSDELKGLVKWPQSQHKCRYIWLLSVN